MAQRGPRSPEHLLAALDGSGSEAEWRAVKELRAREDLPELLLERYRTAKNRGTRAACVYHSIRYATESQAAFDLAVTALDDRSKVVRYRAAMLLAVAQRPDAIPRLERMVASGNSTEDGQAAIAAIRDGHPDRYVDRDGSGMVSLNIG